MNNSKFKVGDRVVILKWEEPIPYTGTIRGFDLCTTSNINVLLDNPTIYGRSFWFCPTDIELFKSSEHERVNTMNNWNIEYRIEKTNELVFWLMVEADSEEMALSESERLFNQSRRYTTKRGTIVATAIQAEGDNSAWLASVRAEMKGE